MERKFALSESGVTASLYVGSPASLSIPRACTMLNNKPPPPTHTPPAKKPALRDSVMVPSRHDWRSVSSSLPPSPSLCLPLPPSLSLPLSPPSTTSFACVSPVPYLQARPALHSDRLNVASAHALLCQLRLTEIVGVYRAVSRFFGSCFRRGGVNERMRLRHII